MLIVRRNAQAGCYTVTHTGDDRADVEKLFGVNILPTSFTSMAEPRKVLHVIKDLNPAKTVTYSS